VSRIVPQRDERLLEAEQGEVLLLVQPEQAEDLPVERLRAVTSAEPQQIAKGVHPIRREVRVHR
jgi:hypothetical protein